ncbi:unnamed protein product [Meganyctiphanes norvegica]|uniref:Uncharacterized protein n=1 Tax=Meganyctiphanes norvegica TaxID=48144 RepID=A0AAV2PL66_MEGNR
MARRERFYSCVNDEQSVINVEENVESLCVSDDTVINVNEIEERSIISDDRSVSTVNKNEERPKSTNKPKRPVYKTQIKLSHSNTNKGESMIKARHDYTKKVKSVSFEKEECIRSPKTKKRKRMDDTVEIKEEIWSLEATITLKQLESLTENMKTVELLNCFDVDGMEKNCYGKTRENIRILMQTWNEKEHIIIQAIDYINNGGNMDKIKTLMLEELVSCLIIYICNRMPNICNECNEWYSLEKGNYPRLRCIMCNLGMHDCRKMYTNSLRSGIAWMCPKCNTVNNEDNVLKNIKMKKISEMSNYSTTLEPVDNRKDNVVKGKIRNERKSKEN